MGIKNKLNILKRLIKYPGGLMHKIKYLEMANLAYKNDVIDFRIDRIATEYTEDFFKHNEVSKEEKKWAYSKGLAYYKMVWYYKRKLQ